MDEEKIKRIINRERLARKEAERLLEIKSSELHCINKNLEKTISERTEKLLTALNEAKVLGQSKDDFLSNMSHEIRTPLNAIIGFVEIMIANPYNEKDFFNYLNIIQSSSKNLLQIINDILDFSKLQSGKFQLSLVSVNLREKLENTFQIFSEQAKEKSLYYEIVFSDGFPSCLILDETRIIQILSNFISNAIKFTSPGLMVIIFVDYNPQKEILTLKVEDTGIGIDPLAQNKIFKSFEQEDASVTREFGGTGLGLAISKQLIELMEGELIFRSVKGEGSTFGFHISAVEGTQNDTLEAKVSPVSEKQSYKGKVLIAEDNEMNIILIETLMENLNIDFELVVNGELAVDAVKNKHYDLVLMDNQMPKLSGKEATKLIRKFNTVIPIVALSANAIKSEQEEFIEAGMNATLAKPISFEKLQEQLALYLL